MITLAKPVQRERSTVFREPAVSLLPEFAVSPSLQTHVALPPAHEVKFVLTESEAQRVEATLRSLLIPDPHAACDADGSYSTTTLYCDTPDFDLFHRRGKLARRKFRLRRYGHDDVIFLERKTKQGTRVRKRRSPIAIDELQRLNQSPTEFAWDGDWFHRRLAVQQLRPVLAVMYDRRAFVGHGDDGPLRLTFDRAIRGRPVTDWHIAPFDGGHHVLTDRVVCEFKFRGAMPAPFKAVVEAERLSPGAASKYRLCLAAAGEITGADHV